MQHADAIDIAALDLLAVELQLSLAVSIAVPKMPPTTERPVVGGLLGFVEAVKDTRPELAIHSLAGPVVKNDRAGAASM